MYDAHRGVRCPSWLVPFMQHLSDLRSRRSSLRVSFPVMQVRRVVIVWATIQFRSPPKPIAASNGLSIRTISLTRSLRMHSENAYARPDWLSYFHKLQNSKIHTSHSSTIANRKWNTQLIDNAFIIDLRAKTIQNPKPSPRNWSRTCDRLE